MKSSVGVTICAVFVLIGSALGLIGAGGIAFIAAGPLARQLFDPSNLPPGADVGLMRSMMIGSAFITGMFAIFGIATGVGLIRLWKWARYAAIGLGAIVIIGSVLPGIAILLMPLPPPSPGQTGPIPAGFRMLIAGFYAFWAVLAGIFVYVMARKSTAVQFNGGSIEMPPRVRPLSVTIIGWYMIVSAALGLPLMAIAHVPALFLGLLLTAGAAKAYYILYLSLYALLGIGLLKRTSEAIAPSIGFHAFAMLNALVLLLPSVWLRYRQASRTMSLFGDAAVESASNWGRYFGVGVGVLMPAIIIFFLLRARRSLPAATNN